MTTTLSPVESWLYSALSGNAAGCGDRVYDTHAPLEASYPLVTFQYQGGTDVTGVGGQRIMTSALYVVRAIGQTRSFADLDTIAAAIDSALQAVANPAAGVLGAVREQPFRLAETDNGIEYRHLGGIYRIWFQT